MVMAIVISVDGAHGGSVQDDAWERNNARDNGINVTRCSVENPLTQISLTAKNEHFNNLRDFVHYKEHSVQWKDYMDVKVCSYYFNTFL